MADVNKMKNSSGKCNAKLSLGVHQICDRGFWKLTWTVSNQIEKKKSIKFMMGKDDNLTFVAWIGDSCDCYAVLLSFMFVFLDWILHLSCTVSSRHCCELFCAYRFNEWGMCLCIEWSMSARLFDVRSEYLLVYSYVFA